MRFLDSLKGKLAAKPAPPAAVTTRFNPYLRLTAGFEFRAGVKRAEGELPLLHVAQLDTRGVETLQSRSLELAFTDTEYVCEIGLNSLDDDIACVSFMLSSYDRPTLDQIGRLCCTVEMQSSPKFMQSHGLNLNLGKLRYQMTPGNGVAIFGQLFRDSHGWAPELMGISSYIGDRDAALAKRDSILSQRLSL